VFVRNEDARPVAMAPGVTRRTLALGPALMLVEITLEAGGTVATHQHPHEQIGYVVSGDLEMEIGGERRRLRAGDAYAIPGGTPHMATAVTRTVVVDVFHPHRAEYR
jgi:quercetin dioxygenase-like cupin family protein